jgi:hypothetical protein
MLKNILHKLCCLSSLKELLYLPHCQLLSKKSLHAVEDFIPSRLIDISLLDPLTPTKLTSITYCTVD